MNGDIAELHVKKLAQGISVWLNKIFSSIIFANLRANSEENLTLPC